MVSCKYIIVMVCAMNKLSLIQEEEEEEQPFMKLKLTSHDSICELGCPLIMLSVMMQIFKVNRLINNIF